MATFLVHDNIGGPQEAPVTGQLCWRNDWSLDNLDEYKVWQYDNKIHFKAIECVMLEVLSA